MPPFVRVYHVGSTITAREHRRDEMETGDLANLGPGLGEAAYTHGNVMAEHAGETWFIIDLEDVLDDKGEIPWEAITVINPTQTPPARRVSIDPAICNERRAHWKAVTPGAGGRFDTLSAKAQTGPLTPDERADFVALAMGIS